MVLTYDKPWTRNGVQTLGIFIKPFVCWATTGFDRSTSAFLGPVNECIPFFWLWTHSHPWGDRAFIGKGKHLHKGEPIIPKHINGRRFLELLHINENDINGCLDDGWVPLEILYKWYGKSDEFEVYGKKLRNNGCRLTGEAHSYDVFVVAFLGIIVFPKKGRKD